MTITILPTTVGSLVGPGLPLRFGSTFNGTLPPNSKWEIAFTQPTVELGDVLFQTWPAVFPTSFPDALGVLMGDPIDFNFTSGTYAHDDTATTVSITLRGNNTNLDTGTVSATWDARTGLANQALAIAMNQKTNGGLSPAQATQLSTIETNTSTIIDSTTVDVTDSSGVTTPTPLSTTLAEKAITALTTTEITSGPTFDTVTRNLTAFVWGIIIRIANIPPNIFPITPDDDYFLPDLAVVRIRHGTDLFLRRPIHTSSAIIPLDRGPHEIAFQAVEVALWPSAITLEVNWKPGVSGQVFLMLAP